ncbi:MAG: thiamine-monophosphate kinase [Motiliproteus sp.]|jgi:thiamine-monophosphate kinase
MAVAEIAEFELIERYFSTLPGYGRGVDLGIGDDCALLSVPEGQQLAVSIDTLVEGVHFLPGMPADELAHRALASCVSDLAAMGATPAWLTLALTLPKADEAWLRLFSQGLGAALQRYGLSLVGGDTTRGPRLLSLQVHGWVPRGQALTRRGARPGDGIWVSGTLGDAMAGLDQLQQSLLPDGPAPDPELLQRFYRPSARIELGQALRGIASSGLDISDGLLADLGHLLKPDKLGAQLDLDRLPCSRALQAHYEAPRVRQWALAGGEDFELCFTVPVAREAALKQALSGVTVGCRQIGRVTAEPGLVGLTGDGEAIALSPDGYQHF